MLTCEVYGLGMGEVQGKYDVFRKRDHDDHQGDDALPEGEKSVKRSKTSKNSKTVRGSSSKQPAKETNTSASEQQQQQD
ncbi:hypothetical protein Tco_0938314 [Tanacetum coccineum]|uniref:Uncharacterized protein n=1 Tax=Tanacetum coccineum TaxID=301880 RepID=A0ABQ5DHH4_9ASTR